MDSMMSYILIEKSSEQIKFKGLKINDGQISSKQKHFCSNLRWAGVVGMPLHRVMVGTLDNPLVAAGVGNH
jgi:hypothetical protein